MNKDIGDCLSVPSTAKAGQNYNHLRTDQGGENGVLTHPLRAVPFKQFVFRSPLDESRFAESTKPRVFQPRKAPLKSEFGFVPRIEDNLPQFDGRSFSVEDFARDTL